MLDAITSFFSCAGLLDKIAGVWNAIVEIAYGLLTVSPNNFMEGAPWRIMNSITPYFTALGASLIVLFFVMGFCSESINVRSEFQFEHMIKLFIKLLIADYLVVNGLTMIKGCFRSVVNLTSLVQKGYPELTVSGEWEAILDEGGIINWFLLLLVLIFAIVCGGSLIYVIYSRFFKLLLILPLAPVAFSTLAGSQGVAHSASAWFKSFLAYTLEIVVIAIALSLSGAMVGAASIIPTENNAMGAILTIASLGITMAITVGSVKGAESILRKSFGL